MTASRLFQADPRRFEGVRLVNIVLLRALYFLMAAVVGTRAWMTIVTHDGPWDPMRAVVLCVWAMYPTIGILGVRHPLRMLPIVIFMIAYKLLWLVVVAYPLWRAGTLEGSPAESLTGTFLAAMIAILFVPWGYVLRTYVRPRSATASG